MSYDTKISLWPTIYQLFLSIYVVCRWMPGPGKVLKRSQYPSTYTSACTCCSPKWRKLILQLVAVTPKLCLDITAPLGNVQSSKLWQPAWLPLHMKPSNLPSDSECQDPRSVWNPNHVSCSLSPRCSSPELVRVGSKSDLVKTGIKSRNLKAT